jgi:hypothetical protein
VICSFLALGLKQALEQRIATLGLSGSWPEIVADLDSLTETAVEQDGKRFLLRAPPRSAASLALRAVGVALPPTVRPAAEARRLSADHITSCHAKISTQIPVADQ